MLTSSQLALLRWTDKSALVGIDTAVGSSLTSFTDMNTLSVNPFATIRYMPDEKQIVITQNGAVLNGYNFADTRVVIHANNVTIENSTFSAGTNFFALVVDPGYSNTVITNNTFNGGSMSNTYPLAAFIYSKGANTTITNNEFLNSPGDAIDSYGGTITGNYFSGGGHSSIGTHPDAIWITNSQSPTVISNNFVDWTWGSGATDMSTGETNNAIRITSELGNVSNVTVQNNVLLGGGYTIDAGNAGSGTFSNVNISNNYVGFGYWGNFMFSYGNKGVGVTETNNTNIDFTNPIFSSAAWQAYQAAGVGTDNTVISSGGRDIIGSNTGSTTLYGNGTQEHLFGTANETVFIGGSGQQYLLAGAGTNIFRYLSFADSTIMGSDSISFFNVAKDVIDLSRIDADPGTPGTQNLRFIGSNAFSAAGGEVRVVQDSTRNVTYVQATMAGSGNIVFQITLGGQLNLTAANFALTAAQSSLLAHDSATSQGGKLTTATSYLADGSSQVRTYNSDGSYLGVTRSASAQVMQESAVDRSGNVLASQTDSASGNTILLSSDGDLINIGASNTVKSGVNSFAFSSNANTSVNVNGHSGSKFSFAQGFGHATVSDLFASGSYAQLNSSMFSYLNRGMTQSQDLAAVLAHSTSSASGLTISDSHGDTLTIANATAASLLGAPSHLTFV